MRWIHPIGDTALSRLIGNSAWLFSASGAALMLSVPQTLLVTRAVGVSQYGMIVIVMTFVTTCNLVTAFRMSEFVVKYVSEAVARNDLKVGGATIKMAMLAETLSSLVAFVGIWLIAPFGARVFLNGEVAADLIRVYAPVVLCNLVFESASGVLQTAERFRLQAQVAVAGHVAKFIAVLIAALGPGTVRAFLVADVAGQAVTASALTVAAWRETGRRFGVKWWRSPVSCLSTQRRSMVHFAVNTNISGTFSTIYNNSDLLLIGYFRTSTEVGYFNLALRLVTLAMRPVEPMTQAVYPSSTRELALGKTQEVWSLWRRGSKVAIGWTLPVSLVLAGSAFWAIPAVFGPSFASAAPALWLLLPGIAISHVVFWLRPALLALGLVGYATLINIGIGVSKIGLSLLIVPAYGYLGSAGLATVLTLASIWLVVRKVLVALAARGRVAGRNNAGGRSPTTPESER